MSQKEHRSGFADESKIELIIPWLVNRITQVRSGEAGVWLMFSRVSGHLREGEAAVVMKTGE